MKPKHKYHSLLRNFNSEPEKCTLKEFHKKLEIMEPEEQVKQIQDFENKGKKVFLIDEDGNILGNADYTRWNKAKPYQKLLGKIFKRYKAKFVDVKGFEIN